ncbi:DAR GTPase 2, mitochondrial-like isoform X3 [Euphorbia lathyris]|uniref:DAR GTPase 2, mitochondrial-like isoform X3 n=1 Tax=Euphorbia lathyris TaxID=212925 RepID=UPI003313CDD1
MFLLLGIIHWRSARSGLLKQLSFARRKIEKLGILPPQILDADICSKLAITGAIRDCLVGEKELAQYFLAILNLSDEYKKWAKFSTHGNNISYIDHKAECSSEGQSGMKRKTLTDHTQVHLNG